MTQKELDDIRQEIEATEAGRHAPGLFRSMKKLLAEVDRLRAEQPPAPWSKEYVSECTLPNWFCETCGARLQWKMFKSSTFCWYTGERNHTHRGWCPNGHKVPYAQDIICPAKPNPMNREPL